MPFRCMKMNPHFGSRLVAILSVLTSVAASQAVLGASVSLYDVGKTVNYEQTSDSSVTLATDSAYAFQAFAVATSSQSVFGALVYPPGSQFNVISLQQDGTLWSDQETYNSQVDLDSAFSTGSYSNSWITPAGFESALLTLPAGTYPNSPQISNYAAAQTVDATKDFTLNWNAFAGAGANDFVLVTVSDDSSTVGFRTGFPGQPNALAGTAQSVNIPANTLKSGVNTVIVGFNKVASRDTTSLAGAVGITTYSAATTITVTVGGTTTGGGGDTTPPTLVSATPPNSVTTSVPATTPVVFTFSEAMTSSESIIWNFQGFDASKIVYSWSTDQKTLTAKYTGGFPSGVISWVLNQSGFTDLAGNQLTGGANLFGFFTVAGGQGGGGNTNNPCGSSTNSTHSGTFTIFKQISYLQGSSNAPTIDPEQGANFGASVVSPTNNPITQVTLTLPTGATITLSNVFGFFLANEQFSSQGAMDAAYPSGTYTAHIQRTTGSATATVTLSANPYPPTPQISNFDLLKSYDATIDETLRWLPFTGAQTQDGISLNVRDSAGHDFQAPDPCIPRALTNTATSIVIPKNTFASGSPIEGSLMFSKYSTFDTNSVPGIVIFAGASRSTSFKPQSADSVQPVLQNFSRATDGTVHFQVSAGVGANLLVEVSNDLVTWTTVSSGIAASGTMDVIDSQAVGQPYRFYRASSL